MDSIVLLKRWQQLSPAEQAAVLGLNVTAQQVEFAGTVEQPVRACQEDRADEVAGLAIVGGQGIVGFMALKRGSQAPAWAHPKVATVNAMRVDISWQGMGLGTVALKALPSWVARHRPDSTEIMLSVDEENHPARRAYARAGFVDLGRREQGRIGWVRYLSLRGGPPLWLRSVLAEA